MVNLRRSAAANERLRRQYRPRVVRVLFVGESPPASGRFFYAGDSGLFRALREAFHSAFPPRNLDADFRETFRDLSCALIDLCARPVDDLAPPSRRARCRASEPLLARRIAAARPRAIVTLVRSIEPNVARAEACAGWDGEQLALPYPGRWTQARRECVALLAPALRRWARSGLLPTPRVA